MEAQSWSQNDTQGGLAPGADEVQPRSLGFWLRLKASCSWRLFLTLIFLAGIPFRQHARPGSLARQLHLPHFGNSDACHHPDQRCCQLAVQEVRQRLRHAVSWVLILMLLTMAALVTVKFFFYQEDPGESPVAPLYAPSNSTISP